jgi:RNA polymerase sigma-70 factor (sigma-E family)
MAMTPTGTADAGGVVESFEDYVRRRGADLERYAHVLAGDPIAAQDLVQTALIKALRRWRSIAAMDEPHAYIRRIVTTAYLDERRRHRRSPVEQLTAAPPDGPTGPDPATAAADLDAIGRALDVLTRQQRAVIVLRHFLDLDDNRIAAELGCSPGTVRSHASRALHRLRAAVNYPDLEWERS